MERQSKTPKPLMVYPSSRKRPFRSLTELCMRKDDPALEQVCRLYRIDRIPAMRLTMNDQGYADTLKIMGAPRESVEEQSIITVLDLQSRHEAIINPLRHRRASQPATPAADDLIEQERSEAGCRFCLRDGGWHSSNQHLWCEPFGPVLSADRRVTAWPNWARQSPISGIVFGDERMHNFLRLSRADFIALFEAAETYITKAMQVWPEARYFEVFQNGGPKSAGTVSHAHLQVVGRGDRHFAYPERVAATCPGDYWAQVQAVHDALGLTLRREDCVIWANVAPVKERDICMISHSLLSGAAVAYEVLEALKAHGTNNFSMSAILSPGYVAGRDTDRRFSEWPRVLWRLVDRGDMRARHADWGTMELFASNVVATDPFLLAQWLRAGLSL